jgi:hypothetical protein
MDFVPEVWRAHRAADYSDRSSPHTYAFGQGTVSQGWQDKVKGGP